MYCEFHANFMLFLLSAGPTVNRGACRWLYVCFLHTQVRLYGRVGGDGVNGSVEACCGFAYISAPISIFNFRNSSVTFINRRNLKR